MTCIPDILFDAWTYPLEKGQSPDEIFQEWQREGDDYLLIFEPGYAFVLDEAKNNPAAVSKLGSFQETLKHWMTPVWTNNLGHTLYGWK